MISIQYLFHSIDDFKQKITAIDRNRECLIQIFTSILEAESCILLARQIKDILPYAHIIGSSVNGVVYRGKQYDHRTMITIEQYKNCHIDTQLFSIQNLDAQAVVKQLHKPWNLSSPKLLRLFLGAYYPHAHQLMNEINTTLPGMEVVGGMSGELYQSNSLPFVFNDTEAIFHGLICAGLTGNISTYHRINTSHERISEAYTITKSEGRTIYEIDGESAQNWLQRNLGFKSNHQYDTWKEIADNDPLVRFQISLEGYHKASRFLRYDEPTKQITQYFTELESGDKFRISYTSPAKCVEECKETCAEVMETPMEQLFCYSCVIRKLYMKNCAQWELSPFHHNPVSGVFLLGEFGHQQGANEVLNGTCVLSGIGEEEHYLQVDLSRFDQLDDIQEENEDLFDFLNNKKKQSETAEHQQLIADAITHEQNHQPDTYRYIDTRLNISNFLQYELDKAAYGFDKICLLKIENADILISFMGQVAYLRQLKQLIDHLLQLHSHTEEDIYIYSGNSDSIVIAATAAWIKEAFVDFIYQVVESIDTVKDQYKNAPIIMRFVIVSGSEHLLEQAYGQAELNKSSQCRIIIHNAQTQDKVATREELNRITLIQDAIANNRIIPYYQGIYNNQLKKIDKYEALMRIQDEDGNIYTPFTFMDLSKKYRLYLDLNRKMLEVVLDDFSTIDCLVNINLCAHDVDSPLFRETLRQKLKTFPKPENITFEILEDEYFADIDALNEFIAEVRNYGVKISIDDFGSGYSNLLEIIKIQPDCLKIDGEIIRESHLKQENEIIVNVISSLAKKLSINLVAEFVENEEVQKIVEKYNILRSQGYLFSKPQPFSAVYAVEKHILTNTEVIN